MPADIDLLKPEHHLVDLVSHSDGDFGSDDYLITQTMDDILLVEYIDLSDDGNMIKRNGLFVPVNTLTKAWRKGKVLIAGIKSKNVKVGDIVIFPNNMGITVNKLPVQINEEEYVTKQAVFLNEDRLFGICKAK